jgi:hypothetical protein
VLCVVLYAVLVRLLVFCLSVYLRTLAYNGAVQCTGQYSVLAPAHFCKLGSVYACVLRVRRVYRVTVNAQLARYLARGGIVLRC